MSPPLSRKLKFALTWSAIALAGAAAAIWRYRVHDASLRTQLLDDARRSAVAFDPANLRGLTGDPADLATPAFRAVNERLRRLREIDPRMRLYLFRVKSSTGDLVFLGGDGMTGMPGGHAPTRESPALQEILRTGRPAIDGPFDDPTGTWATGYVFIDHPAAGEIPADRHVLAFEFDAADWRRELWQSAMQGAFATWIILGLPWFAWFVARRQHEQREVIRNLSEAMEQSHSAIMILDLASRIEYANRGLVQQIGYSRRELIGREWRDFHVPQAGDATLSDLLATVRSGRAWEGEWFNQRKDGTIYPARGVVTPVKHRDGSMACFVAVFDDVTEAKAREAELRDARDLAQAGDRAKGQFLATMSHEVRTPLNGIVGFTSLLLETALTSEQRDYVQTIRMSTEALIQLTGDILDFARIESGKLKLDPLACDPRECMEDALDLLATKAAEKKIELLHRVAADVPAAVLIDGGRVRQVLANLIGNGVKFTEKGEVEVRLAVVSPDHHAKSGSLESLAAIPVATGDCLLEFSVHDTGIGIAAEHHGKLFHPFTQVDESTTRRYGGTGLGLAICRNLVELMGGTIHVKSALGHGATFTFTVRATVAAPPPPPHDLGGLRIGLALHSEALRRELVELTRSWRAEIIDAATPEQLATTTWDLAMIEVCAETAQELAHQEPRLELMPDKTFGLVPVSLSNEMRAALRMHFRLLVNKPVHHDALFALLSGSRPSMAGAAAQVQTRFGFRVLIVEDNIINQRLSERVLMRLGCTAVIARDGREGVSVLRERAADFDLVLLDLHMPEMDGITALREIRSGNAGPRAQTMWIIALTADVREQQRKRAMDAGLNEYLTKPLDIAELEAALRRYRTDRLARKH